MENCVRASFFAVAIAVIAWTDASAQTYRWVDKDGAVHYTQTPPPPDATKVQKKNFNAGVSQAPDLSYATQLAAKKSPVTLYTYPDCGAPCDQARALLVKRVVPFREVSITTTKQADELKKLSGKSEVPLLVVGERTQGGFEAGVYNGLLDSAGYPSGGLQVPIEALRKTDAPEKTADPAAGSAQQGTGAPAK
jgi:glutaredoxin